MKNTWSKEWPQFLPDYEPLRMIELGVFGGTYFGNQEVTGINYHDYIPNQFFMECRPFHFQLIEGKTYNKAINQFGVISGRGYKDWITSDWIREQDPYGWFNWYINFYYGRRSDDDKRQIGRWSSFKGRHAGTLKRTGLPSQPCHGHKTRQNMLHWAIDSFKIQ